LLPEADGAVLGRDEAVLCADEPRALEQRERLLLGVEIAPIHRAVVSDRDLAGRVHGAELSMHVGRRTCEVTLERGPLERRQAEDLRTREPDTEPPPTREQRASDAIRRAPLER